MEKNLLILGMEEKELKFTTYYGFFQLGPVCALTGCQCECLDPLHRQRGDHWVQGRHRKPHR
jgi:hypothetical protein